MSSTSASTELRSRSAEAIAASNCGMRTVGDQFAFQELLREGTYAAVHGELGNDQQGQDHQEPGMNLHILQEGDGHAPAPQVPFQSTEHQERQPGQQRHNHDALAHQPQRIVRQVRPAQKLEERAAQDEREVRRSLETDSNSRRRLALFIAVDV